jgi:L-ascorbate metabolism protein UlaG (beta-lactamase superfamily)
MQITYHGQSCFRFKGLKGTIVTDPYDEYIGFSLPSLSADIVTVSHQHKDHNQVAKIKGTARRKTPFIVDNPGEYEIGGVSVFGFDSFHDNQNGADRGHNTIFVCLVDGVKICHLGDLGHLLKEEQLAQIGEVDVLLIPVGGVYTINPEQAVKVIKELEPSYVIPMHFKTALHDENVFGDLATDDNFFKLLNKEPAPQEKLDVGRDRLPEEIEVISLIKI